MTALALHSITGRIEQPAYVTPDEVREVLAATLFYNGFEIGEAGQVNQSGLTPGDNIASGGVVPNSTPMDGTNGRPTAAKAGTAGTTLPGQTSGTSNTTAKNVYRDLTGLNPGSSYTLSAWFTRARATAFSIAPQAWWSVDGLGSGPAVASVTDNAWMQLSMTFLATADTHRVRINWIGTLYPASVPGGSAEGAVFLDEVSIVADRYTLVVPGTSVAAAPSVALDITRASISLDEARSPFITGTLDIAGDLSALLGIDPRRRLRVVLTATATHGKRATMADLDALFAANGVTTMAQRDTFLAGKTMTQLDAMLNPPSSLYGDADATDRQLSFDLMLRRSIVNRDGTARLTVASDEAELQDYGNTQSIALTPPSLSVLSCVNLAVARMGVLLASTGTPVPQSATLYESDFESGSLSGWAISPYSTAPVTVSTEQAHGGTRSLKLGAAGSTTVTLYGLEPARSHRLTLWVYTATSQAVTVRAADPYDPTNNGVVTSTASGWRQVTINRTPTRDGLAFTVSGTGVVYVDDAMLVRPAYTDETRARMTTAEAAAWQPGESAWSYIQPVLQAAGLKLWCDERREWHLQPQQTYTRGTTALSEDVGLTDVGQEIDRDDDTWFDAAVCVYTWTDAGGVQQVRTDAAVTPGYQKVVRFDYRTAYPGPGAAAQLVQRAVRRGRTFPIQAVTDLSAYPGNALTLDALDGAAITPKTGFVQSVEFRWPNHLMTVTPRAMEDA